MNQLKLVLGSFIVGLAFVGYVSGMYASALYLPEAISHFSTQPPPFAQVIPVSLIFVTIGFVLAGGKGIFVVVGKVDRWVTKN